MTSVYCDYDTGMKWQRILLDKGWLVPSWPIEYGGTNWTMTQYTSSTASGRANPPPVSPMGLIMLGPALLGCGTWEQRDYYLPRMLRGDLSQGYSNRKRVRTWPAADRRGCRRRRLHRQRHQDLDHTRIANGCSAWCVPALRAAADGRDVPAVDMKAPGVSTQPIRFFSAIRAEPGVFDNVACRARSSAKRTRLVGHDICRVRTRWR